MSEDNAVRRRTKQNKVQNGGAKNFDRKEEIDPEFAFRESPLTVLKENSAHIRAIYHIFIVILVVLFCETVIFDLVERGKINIGLSPVTYGFGDIRRGAKLWLFDFMLTLLYYPCFRLYAAGYKFLKHAPAIRRAWKILGIIGLIALQTCIIVVPSWDLKKKHLELGSSSAVTVEMFRFAMKIHAVTIACGPRCHDDKEPLPSLKHYLYFLFAPTLIYRDKYPRNALESVPNGTFCPQELSAIRK